MKITTTANFIIIIIPFIFILISPPSAAVIDPRDYLALQALRSSLADLPGSSFFSTWDFTGDPCSTFSGVLCSAGRVVSLSLGDPRAGSPGLSGRLPSSLGLLSALSDLSLVPGRVYGPIPSSISLCSDLRFLALSQNLLFGSIPHSLSRLRYLKTLDLSFNLLTGAIPPLPSSLVNLILCHNRLAGEMPNLSSSSSLARLDLKRNKLTGTLRSLPASLHYLSLSNNNLGGSIDGLRRLSKLNYLDLSANRFSGPIPSPIFGFPISSVYLQRNMLSGPLRVAGPVVARTVDLSYNRLTGLIPAGLATAERIYLNFNGFYGEVPARFVERVRRGEIKILYLQHNYLRGMDVGVVPRSVLLCLNFNCMPPPPGNLCPVRAGRSKRRPAAECSRVKQENAV